MSGNGPVKGLIGQTGERVGGEHQVTAWQEGGAGGERGEEVRGHLVDR